MTIFSKVITLLKAVLILTGLIVKNPVVQQVNIAIHSIPFLMLNVI